MAFIAGRYIVKYGGNYLGQTDGVRIDYTFQEDPIRGDLLGDSLQDGVYRGGNCTLHLTLMKYGQTGLIPAALWPFSGTFGQAGTIGQLASSIGATLTLEAAPGTPAHSLTAPRKMTASNAILTPGVPIEFDLRPSHRTIPVQFSLLPYTDTGVDYFFKSETTGTTSEPAVVGGFVAGKYDVTYNAVSIGQTDGVRMGWMMHAQPIMGDNLGGSIQDYIYRGADVWFSMTLMEYNQSGARQAFWPYYQNASNETDVGKIADATRPIGRLASGLAKQLVLTALTGTPAAAHTLTAAKSILAAGTAVSLLYIPGLRTVPIRFNVLPTGSPIAWFTSA